MTRMHTIPIARVLGFLVIGLPPLWAAVATDNVIASANAGAASETVMFTYRPPAGLGAPKGRTGGGTRSMSQFRALAPAHVALSTNRQPQFYWHIAPGFRNRLSFEIVAVGASKPLLETDLPPEPNGGIHRLDLELHKVRLKPGTTYQWTIVLRPMPHERWKGMATGGMIKVVAEDPQLKNASVRDRPYIAARKGIWYDALGGISRLVENQPDAAHWRLERATLLEQGGLVEAAAYERSLVGGN